MPIITVEYGKSDRATKAKLVEVLTQKTSEVLNIPENSITTMIKENDPDNVAIGGKLLSELRKEQK